MNKQHKTETLRLIDSYNLDITGLESIIKKHGINKILNQFNNHDDFLKSNASTPNNSKLLKGAAKHNGTICTCDLSPKLIECFENAHVSACCELLRDWQVPPQLLQNDGMKQFVNSAINPTLSNNEKMNEVSIRVHNSDAMRTAQILKYLGLINTNKKFRQLSFAAGHGNRDINGFHSTPEILPTKTFGANNRTESLSFYNKVNKPEYVVLIDNDPVFGQQYNLLNSEQHDWILAINKDANIAMQELPDTLNNKNWKPVNLILGLRIDHRMIPDVKYFFSQISTLIGDSADLVISIGAGHTLDEFIGRKKKILEIFNYLKKSKLSPLRIQMHSGKTHDEQRQKPSFGLLHYTTYEILYCKLKKKMISS
ncbi:MAG TPA: hypothetical protein VIQ81_13405 [Gammaproteobacteria bacterium]